MRYLLCRSKWQSKEGRFNEMKSKMKPKKKMMKMTEEEKVYEELRQAFSRPRTPLAAPRSPEAMKLFKFFFPTREEAEIGKHLEAPTAGGRPKTAAEIAEESGKNVEKVEAFLKDLARKAVIRWREKPGAPGVIEYFQNGLWTMAIFPGFALTSDRPEGMALRPEPVDAPSRLKMMDFITAEGKAYKELASRVWDEQFIAERSPSKYPICRTLVLDRTIDAGSKVLTYETTSGVIRGAFKKNVHVALRLCGCRVREQKCNHRIDVCFAIGDYAKSYIPVSEADALKRLDEGFKEGLVATTWNNIDPAGAMAICMCCPCCCDILGGYVRNVTGWGNPYQTMKSNFDPKVDREKCNLCELCVKKCPVKARWHHWPHKPDLSDNFIFLEEERCLGCGVCAYLCPQQAITMVRVRDFTPEPDLASMWLRVEKEARH
jgi:Pyruvate/2-oxoacid:ferredoxin oxidoreductase delta subunit